MSRRLPLALLVLVLVGAACSSDSGDDGPTIDTSDRGTDTGLPLFTGEDECLDEEGDVEGGSETVPGELVDQLDIVATRAIVADDRLTLEFDTAAPVAPAEDLVFLVSKGVDFQAENFFELRALFEEGEWRLRVTRLGAPSGPASLAVEETTDLPGGVEIDGTTARFSADLADLEEIDVSQTWQYGIRLGTDPPLLDLCSRFED